MAELASAMMKETAAKCRSAFSGSEIERACPELRKLLDLAACDLESAATIICHAVETKTGTEWKRYDYKDKATHPTEEGLYRVMVSGDSESCDGHTIYDYPDYPTWANVIEDEGDDGNPCLLFGQGNHDEEHETFFAYCGPFSVPPFNLK